MSAFYLRQGPRPLSCLLSALFALLLAACASTAGCRAAAGQEP